MNRRRLFAVFFSPLLAWGQAAAATFRGKLLAGQVLDSASGRIRLTGDEPTLGVLNDPRVIGLELELTGQSRGPDALEIDPIHKKAMYALKDGKRLFVTYWCDICSIRTYTPGQCWCCQEQTELDLRERYE
ncbi:MAG: hypothetical protein B7X34_05960 [Acidobacteriia bacterium 12-62-4]|nr:MAG: hypothetical protein B7X34_05960 [Acidobacteriia bacterium 12-62-4]